MNHAGQAAELLRRERRERREAAKWDQGRTDGHTHVKAAAHIRAAVRLEQRAAVRLEQRAAELKS